MSGIEANYVSGVGVKFMFGEKASCLSGLGVHYIIGVGARYTVCQEWLVSRSARCVSGSGVMYSHDITYSIK